jgi:hypothetical protein
MNEYLDTLIHESLESGKDVEIKLSDRHGFQIVIDGKAFFDGKDGMPWEIFEYPLDEEWFSEKEIKRAEKLIEDIRD